MSGQIHFVFGRDLSDGKAGPLDGFACPEYNVIAINTDLSPQEQLETAIHEAVHCMFPMAKEPIVERSAHEIADMLWRMGYRRV